MNCTAFIITWSDEFDQIHLGPDCLLIAVDGNTWPELANRHLQVGERAGHVNEFVAVIDGATLSDGWFTPYRRALDSGWTVVSPYVCMGAGEPRAWWEPVSSWAWLTTSAWLQSIGGFDERLIFSQNKLIAKRAGEDSCAHVPDAIATCIVHPGRQAATGDSYYRQLEDQALADSL